MNPFAASNAEQEQDRLSAYFVRPSWFDLLVGNPLAPESFILFAPPGSGKTSHRLEIARIVRERLDSPALVVHFTTFDTLLDGMAGPYPTETVITLLRRRTLEALDEEIRCHSEHQQHLFRNPAAFARFAALLQLYAPLRAINYVGGGTDLSAVISAYQGTQLGAREWFLELADLARGAGFASVYVLIDGLDELAETRAHPEVMLRLITPLVDAPGLLFGSGFALKFFLPQVLYELMVRLKIGRLDRVAFQTLEWSEAQLTTMLMQRLSSHSRVNETGTTGYVNRFRDLCAVDFDVDQMLVQVARGSPRALIAIASTIVRRHCNVSDDPEAPITRLTIEAALLEHTGDETIPSQINVAILNEPLPPAPQVPPLYVDSRSDIWLGEQRLENDLPKMLLRCLLYLWQNRHRAVPYEELQIALYKKSLHEHFDPKSSCDKIVRRLREALEPGRPGSRAYIDIKPGTGYVLRNVREE